MGKRKKKKKKKNDGTFQGKRRGHGAQELDPNSIVFNQNPADIADIEMLDSANFAKGDAKYFNNLHKIVQDETKQKEERQRRIRELRKKKADNIDNSIEELAELDELIAQDQENPANYLASTKRINVPTGQSQGNKRIFDKGLPAIPDTYFEGMKEVFSWDSLRLAQESSTDVTTTLFRHAQVTLAATQQHHIVGNKMCYVSGAETTMAEQTDSLQTLNGGDIVECLPSVAFWFKRRLQNTNTHFMLVNVFREVANGITKYDYFLTDRGTQQAEFKIDYPLKEDQRCLGGISLVTFETGGEAHAVALPLVDNMSLWESFIRLYPRSAHARLLELYEGRGKPPTNEQLGNLAITSALGPVPQTELDMLKTINELRAAISCMGMMAARPDYIGTKIVKKRTVNPDAQGKKASKGKVSSHTIMSLCNPVPDDPITVNGTGIAGGRRREHWRRGHFVRKHHSAGWELAHPDWPVVIFPDGRRAHQTWIKPTIVSASGSRKKKGQQDE